MSDLELGKSVKVNMTQIIGLENSNMKQIIGLQNSNMKHIIRIEIRNTPGDLPRSNERQREKHDDMDALIRRFKSNVVSLE